MNLNDKKVFVLAISLGVLVGCGEGSDFVAFELNVEENLVVNSGQETRSKNVCQNPIEVKHITDHKEQKRVTKALCSNVISQGDKPAESNDLQLCCENVGFNNTDCWAKDCSSKYCDLCRKNSGSSLN